MWFTSAKKPLLLSYNLAPRSTLLRFPFLAQNYHWGLFFWKIHRAQVFVKVCYGKLRIYFCFWICFTKLCQSSKQWILDIQLGSKRNISISLGLGLFNYLFFANPWIFFFQHVKVIQLAFNLKLFQSESRKRLDPTQLFTLLVQLRLTASNSFYGFLYKHCMFFWMTELEGNYSLNICTMFSSSFFLPMLRMKESHPSNAFTTL